jgi:hypothetical protein
MRRWEEDRRIKNHQQKIRDAKPVVKTGVKEGTTPSPHFSRPSSDFAPLKQLLKSFNLQQYYIKLAEEGYDNDTNSIAYMPPQAYSELLSRLKIMPGHRKRFDDLVDFLRQISTCSEPVKAGKRHIDTRLHTAEIMSQASPESTQTAVTMRTLSLFSQQGKAAMPTGSIDEEDEVELDGPSEPKGRWSSTQEMTEYEGSSVSSSLGTAEAFKLKQELAEARAKINALQAALLQKHPNESGEFAPARDLHRYNEAFYIEEQSSFVAEPPQQSPSNPVDPFSASLTSPPTKAYEVPIEEAFSAYEPPDTPALLSNVRSSTVRKSTDVVDFKVTAPVPQVFEECHDNKLIDHDEVGISYDSWKMRSTLANLDIEEMCRCLSKVISRHIEYTASLPQKIDHSLPDFLDDLRKPSCASSESLQYSTESVQYIEPLFRMFEKAFNDPEGRTGTPDEDAIHNYSKNVILRSKMEKEASIICLVYLERIIIRAGLRISALNWKRLLFTSLILASKIWDDESFENKHFAQVFTMFTAEEINTMESVFLTILDYRLIVAGSDYANYYLILRTYSERRHRSFPLRALDVDTVRRLQNTCTRAESSFRDMYRDALYKTM